MGDDRYRHLQWAGNEAGRCLYCLDAPCVEACPAHVDIPRFIRLLRFRDIRGAKGVVKEGNCLGGICGYVCPSGELCEKSCTRGRLDEPVRIAQLQRFACDGAEYCPEVSRIVSDRRVAVIGAGPAGLSCAYTLRSLGYEVELFEKERFLAGTVTREIPEFKVPGEVIERELDELGTDGLTIHLGVEVTLPMLEEMAGRFDAVFMGTGVARDRMVELPGRELEGVYDASRFLSSVKQGTILDLSGTCVTVGGGNTAMDCARTALRLGASRSFLAYRRSRLEMPADEAEFMKAVKEGVEFLWQVSPVRLEGDTAVRGAEFIRNELRAGDGDSRRAFSPVPGSELRLAAETVVFALGKDRDGVFDDLLRSCGRAGSGSPTDLGGTAVFAGGDCAGGSRTVVESVAQGKNAALAIHRSLSAR